VKFGTVAETRLPYVDADLIAALLAAAPRLKIQDHVQSHLLRKRAPELLDIPDANTGASIGAGPWHGALAHFATKLLAKLRAPGFQPYERVGLWLRREHRSFVERILLSERCLDRGVLDRDGVRRVIEDHAAKRGNLTNLLLCMLSFELGQRKLFDGGG
jgi:hypothetical protein